MTLVSVKKNIYNQEKFFPAGNFFDLRKFWLRSGAFNTAGDQRVFLGVFSGSEVVFLLFCIPQAVAGHPEVTEQNKEESGQKSQQRKENPVSDTSKYTLILILRKKKSDSSGYVLPQLALGNLG